MRLKTRQTSVASEGCSAVAASSQLMASAAPRPALAELLLSSGSVSFAVTEAAFALSSARASPPSCAEAPETAASESATASSAGIAIRIQFSRMGGSVHVPRIACAVYNEPARDSFGVGEREGG